MSIKYCNPLWSQPFADPFILHTPEGYFAYGTSPQQSDGRIFQVLHSSHLTDWQSVGGAMLPLTTQAVGEYWAPEVAFWKGRYYLYYSASGTDGDETHRLRVASADHPAGPFVDSGHLLLPNIGFSIDAHPFRDPVSGDWFLFYAQDYFDERPGTALAAIRLNDSMVRTEGEPTTILRASNDWQIFLRDREIYNRRFDAWHTLEGPNVIYRDGLYYCLYSGGNYQTEHYGVGCAVAEHPLGPYCEPEAGPVVLRAHSGALRGPGHNSVVRSPDGVTDMIVYHAYDQKDPFRKLCIDPLNWTPQGPRCFGPTSTPQEI